MLIVIIVPFLLLELFLSLKVGENIGFVYSALWIVISMLIGIKLLQSSSFTMMGNLNAVRTGKLSMQSFKNVSTSYLIAAILLIIPGVLSDFFGFIVLIYIVYLQFVAKITPEQTKYYKHKGDDNVIDAEIIDEHDTNIGKS